ncbi:MAG: class I SAM-dependent methyltransferase [Bifidobacterium sp.]|nr:class I SAM-dependent methyltransferase [Bifidobacterium sp.]
MQIHAMLTKAIFFDDGVCVSYTDANAETIDRWIDSGWEWGVPISHTDFVKAQGGDWRVVLTPNRPVPREWFPGFDGCTILGLASGGGQQMPVFSALGAECTVLDYSQKQLDSERMVAEREKYAIATVRADMTRGLPFEDETFDVVFHPVSNCYIENVLPVWRECHRVLKRGGVLMAGLDNGMNFIVDDTETRIIHSLPFNPLEDASLKEELEKTDSGIQFSHTLDEQIRGQIQAGFSIQDLYEDTNDSGRLHDLAIPSFWATLAIKR